MEVIPTRIEQLIYFLTVNGLAICAGNGLKMKCQIKKILKN